MGVSAENLHGPSLRIGAVAGLCCLLPMLFFLEPRRSSQPQEEQQPAGRRTRAEDESTQGAVVAAALAEAKGTGGNAELAACTRAALLFPQASALQAELDRDGAQRLASQKLLRKKTAPRCTEGEECPADAFPCCGHSGVCSASEEDCTYGMDYRDRFGGNTPFQALHQYRIYKMLCPNVTDALGADTITEITEFGVQVYGSLPKFAEVLDKAVMYNMTIVGQMVRAMYLKQDVDNGNMMVPDRHSDVYKLKSLEMSPGDVAIDVGGRLTFVSLILAKVYGVQVYAVEASPVSFLSLLMNLRLNGLLHGVNASSSVEMYYGALSGKDGGEVVVPIYTGSSRPTVKVPTVALDRIIWENDLKTVKLLKLNCHPCEHEIVPQISSLSIRDRFQYVVY